MRRLIYIPTIHSSADMQDPEFYGGGSERVVKARELVWGDIAKGFKSLGTDLRGVKLFSEVNDYRMPRPGYRVLYVDEVVNLLDSADAKQEELVDILEACGATRMLTEDPELLKLAYLTHMELIDAVKGMNSGSLTREVGVSAAISAATQMLKQKDLRDQAIARYVDEGLAEGDTGLLVLGMRHNVAQFLPLDIEFSFLSPALEARWEVNRVLKEREDSIRLSREGVSPLRERL